MKINKNIEAILIVIFFWFAVNSVFTGILTFIMFEIGIMGDSVFWIRIAGSFIIIILGFFLAAKRLKTNEPLKITRLYKALIFGCIYYFALDIWSIFLFSLNDVFHISGTISKFLINIVPALDYVILFPNSLFHEEAQKLWKNYPLISHFTSSVFWASIFYFLLRVVEKLKPIK